MPKPTRRARAQAAVVRAKYFSLIFAIVTTALFVGGATGWFMPAGGTVGWKANLPLLAMSALGAFLYAMGRFVTTKLVPTFFEDDERKDPLSY